MIPKDRVFSHDQPIGNHMAAPSPGIFLGGSLGKFPKNWENAKQNGKLMLT